MAADPRTTRIGDPVTARSDPFPAGSRAGSAAPAAIGTADAPAAASQTIERPFVRPEYARRDSHAPTAAPTRGRATPNAERSCSRTPSALGRDPRPHTPIGDSQAHTSLVAPVPEECESEARRVRHDVARPVLATGPLAAAEDARTVPAGGSLDASGGSLDAAAPGRPSNPRPPIEVRGSRTQSRTDLGSRCAATPMPAAQLDLDLVRELPRLPIEADWKDRARLWGHAFHPMCSYLASFPAALAHAFIARYSRPGDVVLDPFAGRGTVPLQACVEGRLGVGNDLNPFAHVLTAAKVDPPTAGEAAARLARLRIDWSFEAGRVGGARRRAGSCGGSNPGRRRTRDRQRRACRAGARLRGPRGRIGPVRGPG